MRNFCYLFSTTVTKEGEQKIKDDNYVSKLKWSLDILMHTICMRYWNFHVSPYNKILKKIIIEKKEEE